MISQRGKLGASPCGQLWVMSVMAVHPIRKFYKSAPQLPSTKNSIFPRHGVPPLGRPDPSRIQAARAHQWIDLGRYTCR